MRTKQLLSFFLLSFLWGQAYALTLSDSFDDRSYEGTSSNMMWNQALGYLHPTVFIDNWSDGVVKDTNFSPGDGSDGSFTTAADYAAFSTGGNVTGNLIRLDTDTYSDLNFTNFNLQSGWTIQVTGSQPLVIRSLTGMTIDGGIDCSGADGQDGSSTNSEIRSGGSGRCGGGSGGDSVAPATAPGASNQGSAGGTLITGGAGGAIGGVTGGIGGGGGGGYSDTLADAGEDPNVGGANDGGAVGTSFTDDGFDDDLTGAGSGGGGGSAFNDAGDVPNHSSGGGGGAGGGSIFLYAMQDITISGTAVIRANGGDGGNVGGTLKAGAGGGGAGGSILMFSAGDITVNGIVTATPGFGGTAASGADGGGGTTGRTWLVGNLGDPTVGGTLNPTSDLLLRGDSRFNTGAVSATSALIDIGNTRPTVTTSSNNNDLQGGTVTFEVSFGSSTGDASLASFAAPATYVGTQVGRFMQYRFTLNSVSATNPTKVLDMSVVFDEFTQDEFEFEGACGAVGSNTQLPPWTGMLFIVPLFILLGIRGLSFNEA